jgi:hypothetical protein
VFANNNQPIVDNNTNQACLAIAMNKRNLWFYVNRAHYQECREAGAVIATRQISEKEAAETR